MNIEIMLNKETVEQKMRERGFTVYANLGTTAIHFVSKQMYDMYSYEQNTPPKEQMPIINIIVNLEKNEFNCVYRISGSINTLNSPACGPVMDDKQFDSIVGKFESHAKWLSRITG